MRLGGWVNLHFSIAEGFGFSLIQVARRGVPTAAIGAPSVSGAITEFAIGKVAKDVEGVVQAVKEIIEQRDSWYERVLRNSAVLSWHKLVDSWEKVFGKNSWPSAEAAATKIARYALEALLSNGWWMTPLAVVKWLWASTLSALSGCFRLLLLRGARPPLVCCAAESPKAHLLQKNEQESSEL
ncbi:hypothetical protein PQ610_00615 [Tardisphaera miroshnichenkoae]